MQISCKPDFYRLAGRGLLGNVPRTWPVPEFLRLLPGSGLFGVRYMNSSNGNFAAFLTFEQARREVLRKMSEGVPAEMMLVSEAIPPEWTVYQAEVMRSENYLDVLGGYSELSLRHAIQSGVLHPKRGLEALLGLRRHLDAPGMAWLEELWSMYPDSVVELSVYDRPVGIYGWRTVIWEVRNY